MGSTAAAGAPDYSDAIDFVREIELGYSSPQGRISAPFNVTTDPSGSTELLYVEVNSTSQLPVTVRVFDTLVYHQDNETMNEGNELFVAEDITYLLWDVEAVSVTTIPADNHTALAEIAANFAAMARPPTQSGYYVIVERRAVESARVLYRQDREAKDTFLAIPILLLSMVALATAVVAVVGYVLVTRPRRDESPAAPPAPPPPKEKP